MHAKYYNYPKFLDTQIWANSVDPDQTPHKAASDQDLHCLPLNRKYFSLIYFIRMNIHTAIQNKCY